MVIAFKSLLMAAPEDIDMLRVLTGEIGCQWKEMDLIAGGRKEASENQGRC